MFHYWFWVCWDRSWTQNYTSLQKCIRFIWTLHKYVICIKELIIIEYSGSQKNEWRSTQNWIPVTVLKIYTVFRLFIVLLYIYSLRPRLRSVQSTRRESRATPCSVTITTRSRRFTVNDWRSYVQSTPKNPRYNLFDRFINKIWCAGTKFTLCMQSCSAVLMSDNIHLQMYMYMKRFMLLKFECNGINCWVFEIKVIQVFKSWVLAVTCICNTCSSIRFLL